MCYQAVFAALIFVASLPSCTDEASTHRTLQNEGYTDIQINGYSWFECGDGDTFHTAFTAKINAANTAW